jgi:hypothetical protein
VKSYSALTPSSTLWRLGLAPWPKDVVVVDFLTLPVSGGIVELMIEVLERVVLEQKIASLKVVPLGTAHVSVDVVDQETAWKLLAGKVGELDFLEPEARDHAIVLPVRSHESIVRRAQEAAVAVRTDYAVELAHAVAPVPPADVEKVLVALNTVFRDAVPKSPIGAIQHRRREPGQGAAFWTDLVSEG